MQTDMHFYGTYVLARAAGVPPKDATTIAYTLDHAAPVILAVYDVQGRRVRTLTNGVRQPGEHAVRWDGHDDEGARAAGGVYFVRLLVEGIVAASRQLVLVH